MYKISIRPKPFSKCLGNVNGRIVCVVSPHITQHSSLCSPESDDINDVGLLYDDDDDYMWGYGDGDWDCPRLSCAQNIGIYIYIYIWSIQKHANTRDPDKAAAPQSDTIHKMVRLVWTFRLLYMCYELNTLWARPSWVHCYSSKTIGTFHRYLACCLYNAAKQNTMGWENERF